MCICIKDTHVAAQVSAIIPNKTIGIPQGLPSNLVYEVEQDSKGYLWIATDKGVCKYDGKTFKVFGLKDGMPNIDVWRLFIDSEDRVWLSFFGKNLSYIKNDKVVVTTADRGSINFPIFQEFSKGFITTYDFYFGKYGSWKSTDLFHLNYDNYSSRCLMYMRGEDHYIYLDSPWIIQGLDSKQRKKYEIQLAHYANFDRQRLSMDIDHFKARGLAVSDSLLAFNNKNTLFVINHAKKVIHYIPLTAGVNYAEINKYNEKWVFTSDKELIEFDLNGKVYTKFKCPPGTNSCFMDKTGGVWVTTSKQGLSYYSPRARHCHYWNLANSIDFKPYNLEDGVIGGVNKKGCFWKLENEHVTLDTTLPCFSTNVNCAISPQKGLIWAFNWMHGYEFAYSGRITNRESPIYGMTNVKWASGLWEDGGWRLLATSSVITTYDTISKSTQSNVWYRGRGGRGCIIGPNRFVFSSLEKLYLVENGYIGTIDSIGGYVCMEAHEGEVWVGTQGRGLWRLGGGRRWERQADMPNIVINDICVRGKDDVLLATNQGLFHYLGKGGIRHLTMSDGLVENEILTVNSLNGNVFLGVSSGLVRIPSDLFKVGGVGKRMTLDIESSSVNNFPVYLDNAKLSYFQNDIQIHWSIPYFENPEGLEFQYTIRAGDRVDTVKSRQNFIQFYRLNAGIYQVSAQAMVNGILLSEKRSITFTICKPWWRTGWFFLLAALGIISVLTFYFLRFKHRQRRMKDMVSKQLEALQNQIDMHFSSNMLTSVQRYILEGEPMKASDYIADYAVLLRLFLESSCKKFILLKEEIDLNRHYLELQSMRFGNQIIFDIQVWGLDPDKIWIPTMLVQPFVENAIEHGLGGKPQGGLIQLRFYLDFDDKVVCEVEDNGMGRAAASKKGRGAAFPSRALANVEERIRLYKMLKELEISYHLTDKVDANGIGTGTLVRLRLDKIEQL